MKKNETKNKEKLPVEKKKSKRKEKPGKLPKLLTKKYTAKQLEKKIYKKIYIGDDKKFVKEFISEVGQNKKGVALYAIPTDTKISAKDGKRLALISKEIKKQKGRLKLAPIVAIVVFVTVLCAGVSLTKDLLVRMVITNTCESIFEAKTDIKYVNIRFLDSSFKMKGLQIANKNEPMKNLVEVDSMVFDFDLGQLIRAKVIVDEVAVDGVATNTDRTVSGDLSAKKLAKIQNKKSKEAKKKAKSTEDSEFMKKLTAKSDAALDVLKNSVSGLFDQYNPKTIIDNCYTQLQTPETSKKVQEQAKELTTKYQNKPQELESEITKVQSSIESVTKINIDEIKSDPTKIQEAIKAINDAITSVQALQSTADSTINGMKSDVNTATNLSKELKNAITHDQNLATSELNKLTSLSLNDAKNFITDTFNNVGYAVLGKYYPYAKKATDFLINLKNTNKPKEKKVKTEKTKSTITSRSKGRTVYFNTDTAPKFWIKKASGSGVNFSLIAADITSDMDKTNKPATAKVSLNLNNITHGANLTIDTRSSSTAPLVNADYNCSKLPISFPASNFGNIPGVPGIESANTKLALNMKIYDNSGFTIGGTGTFTNMVLAAEPFEPEFASKIFMNTLAKVDSMNLNINAGYKETDGIIMNLSTDADKKFMNALTSALSAQMSEVVSQAKDELAVKISEITNGALGDLNNFDDISNKIKGYSDYINNMSAQLEAKKKEATDAATAALKNTAKEKIDSTTPQVKDNLSNAAKDLFKKK